MFNEIAFLVFCDHRNSLQQLCNLNPDRRHCYSTHCFFLLLALLNTLQFVPNRDSDATVINCLQLNIFENYLEHIIFNLHLQHTFKSILHISI